MYPVIPQNPQREKIFGSPEQVEKEALKLVELIQLHASFNGLKFPYNRQRTLEKVANIWKDARNTQAFICDLDTFKANLIDQHKEDRRVMPQAVSQFFIEKINATQTMRDLQKLTKRILQLHQFLHTSPIQKSHHGLKGPTLLTNFSRFDLKKDTLSAVSYVMKSTDVEEFCGNRLYQELIANIQNTPAAAYSVPVASGLAFNQNQYQKYNGSIRNLTAEQSNQIQNAFLAVVNALDPEIEIHGPNLMISETIQGENLFEFARSKYPHLSDAQKQQLFFNLAKVVPLDIILGNLDRLIRCEFTPEGCNLAEYEANPGNFMLSQEQEGGLVTVHLIDNALDQNLISSEQAKLQYIQLIQTLFTEENPEKILTKFVLVCLKKGFLFTTENKKDRLKLLEELDPILKDLDNFALPAIEDGIREGIQELRSSHVPFWNSLDSEPLKQQLQHIHPGLLSAVNERMEAFSLITNSRS